MSTDEQLMYKNLNKWQAEEIERLKSRHEGDVKIVKATEACARKHQERAELLSAELAEIKSLLGLEGTKHE